MHPQLAKWMCRYGLTNEEVCKELGIAHKTLLQWAKKHEEFGKAIAINRLAVDSAVEDSLLKRALGYDYEETKVIATTTEDGKTRPLRVEKTKKHIPGEVRAQEIWLRNRMRDKWTIDSQSGNIFNIMNGVLIVPGTQNPEDWDAAAQQVHEDQIKLLSQS
jgi:hypothetical protein